MKVPFINIPMLRFKTFRAKTLFLMLPLIIAILITVETLAFLYSRGIILDQNERIMNEQLSELNYRIQGRITAASKVPEIFAAMVGGGYTNFSLQEYRSFAQYTLQTNQDTFGVGIFFEPNAYKPSQKYFSTYAFHENDRISTTEGYNDPGFDYPNQDFYKLATNKSGVIFSEPYMDLQRKVNMVTATVPIFDMHNQFVGVTTGDIELTRINDIIQEMNIGKKSWTFLIDKNGTYLAGPDTQKIMNSKLQEDSDSKLAGLGKTMIQTKNGTSSYKDKKLGLINVYYQSMPGTNWIIATALPEKELFSPLRSLFVKLIIVSLGGIALLIITIFLFSRSVTGQIGKVNQMSKFLANGNFMHSIQITSKDEFGQMMNNLNHTSAMLRTMLTKVTEHGQTASMTSEYFSASAKQSSQASDEISTMIQGVAIGADTQMISSKELTQTMEELATGIQRVAESCTSVWEVSQQTSYKAEYGNHIIQQAVTEMNEVNLTVTNTAELVEKLSQRTNEIGRIISVIQEISGQTNLLSLNAAIEAARAGEHGRGFSVVSQEIRKLAEHSRASAAEIRTLIEEIQDLTGTVVQSMHIGSKMVNNGTSFVNQAGENFVSILDDIQSMVVQIQEISSSTEQMTASSEEVTATVEEFSNIAEEASGNSQNVAAACQQQQAFMIEITSSAQHLSETMQELQRLTSKFKVS